MIELIYGLLYAGGIIYIYNTLYTFWEKRNIKLDFIEDKSLIYNKHTSRNATYICFDTNTFIKKSYKHEYKTLIKLKDIDEVIDVLNYNVHINDDGEKDYYITMPYLDGWKRLNEYKGDSISIIKIFIKICEGLQKIHNMDVLHCDIKPANIMVSPDEDIVFIDFEETGGTSGYIAPEVIYDKFNESIYTRAVDIWSLGMTMFNVYIDDYSDELYKMTDLKHDIMMKRCIDMEKNINIIVKHSTSSKIDDRMADLFIKILRICPDDRLNLSCIIEELYKII